VPSVVEKYGLPNPVDLIMEERLRVVTAGALAQQRMIEAQVRALGDANAADSRPGSMCRWGRSGSSSSSPRSSPASSQV
jgi:hypothetical protein